MGSWWSVYPLVLLWLLRHRASVDAVVDSQNGIPFFSPLVVRRDVPVLLLVHHVHQDLFGRALRPAAARLARWLEGPVSRRAYRGRTVVVLTPTSRTQVRRRLAVRRSDHGGAGRRGCTTAAGRAQRRPAHRRRRPSDAAQAPRRCSSTPWPRCRHRLPDAELHLIGDGSARPHLEARARRTSGTRDLPRPAAGRRAGRAARQCLADRQHVRRRRLGPLAGRGQCGRGACTRLAAGRFTATSCATARPAGSSGTVPTTWAPPWCAR